MSILDDPSDDLFLNELEDLLNRSNISKENIHYQTSTGEVGETSLEKVDTFRFMRVGNTEVNIYNKNTQNSDFIGTKVKNLYLLHNIPIEILEHIHSINSIYFHPRDTLTLSGATYLAFSFDENSIDIKKCEIFLTSINYHLFEFYTNCKKPTTIVQFPMTKDIRDILNSKKWDFSDFRHIADWKTYPCVSYSLETDFSQDITINFKHKYKITPHISYYITPVEENKIRVYMKLITKTQVIFKIHYGFDKEDMSNKYTIHWKAEGIVENNQLSLLD